MTPRRALVAACAAAAVTLCGCGGGVTVEGRPTSLATARATSYAPPSPTVRTPTPSATPTEDRRAAPGPELTYRTPEGTATLRVVTYSWQRTKFGDRSVAPKDRYLVLTVEITCTAGTVNVLPINFRATPKGGQPTEPALGRDGNEPVLAHKQLQAGQQVGGIVTFDIPQDETTLTVLDELGAKAGEAKIPAT